MAWRDGSSQLKRVARLWTQDALGRTNWSGHRASMISSAILRTVSCDSASGVMANRHYR